MLTLRGVILAGMTILAAAAAQAQRYDPGHPVCLQRWEWGGSTLIDCSFTSLDQCRITASGLSGMCYANPYGPQGRQTSPADRRRAPAH